MYLGHGGELFEAGSAEPSLDTPEAVATLETTMAMSELMNPDYLTFDTDAAQTEFEQGRAAITNMWGSRAGAVIDDQGTVEGVSENTAFAAAPTVAGGSVPATTLWWDGLVIPENVSDEAAAATFRALTHGMTAEVADANAEDAVRLIDGHESTDTDAGVMASVEAGARPYPMLPCVGLMHTALGDELVEFLQGTESAEKALADAAASYTTAAREGG